MNVCSEEQMAIIDQVKEGNNVVVDACAGSGKSTTILSAASMLPNKRFLLITYNKSLRKEVKEKVSEIQLENVVVHTYHSLCVATYNPDAHVDKVMRLLVQNDTPPMIELSPFDIVVLDEVQDMTFLYFRLIAKYIKDIGEKVQLMVLGDYMQGLYEFKGADIRFLTMATDLWRGFRLLKNSESFVSCQLKTSYRITNQMADFVNEVMLGEKRLYACRDGEPVVYIRRQVHELERMVVTTIRDLIDNHGAMPADFFVLGGSVKGPNSAIRRIENALVNANIPCHVPMMENSDHIDEEVIKGKIVFSSFHTSKGRQRPYVFVVGFDNSYFKVIARTLDPHACPNTLYVATTRASKKLYLLETAEWSSDRPFKFLQMSHKEMQTKPYIDFRGIPRAAFEKEDESGSSVVKKGIIHVSPTDLTKFISESVLEEITHTLDSIFIKESLADLIEIQLPTTIRTHSGFYEDVSDLNGIAIPAILYDYIASIYSEDDDEDLSCVLYEMIIENIKKLKPNKHPFLRSIASSLNPACESISDYLYMANVLEATQEKLYFKLKQISRSEYTWLTPRVLSECKKRMLQVLKREIDEGEPEMEKWIISYEDEVANGKINRLLSDHFTDSFVFTARTDLITESTLWELKCTTEISAEHMIQTVIYAWIMRTIDPEFSKAVKIFNIRTGQVLRLDADKATLDTIVIALLKGKYESAPPSSAADFVAECRRAITPSNK
jgi:hypothetical protein